MEKKSIKKNYFYNVSYQILTLITPLITTPYLSGVLGADGIGIVSYAESIIAYFVLFSALGVSTYGQREISYVQDDRNARSRVFWNAKSLQLITSAICLAIYIPFALTREYRVIYLILSMNIISVVFDVTWFFQGMEEFGKIVLRNMIFKLIGIVYIFTIVKTKSDVAYYVFGLSFFALLSNISLWFYLSKMIDKPIFNDIKPFKELNVIISLFIPTIAINIYTVLDKTMIGVITGSSFENGYYEQAIKISKMVLTIVTSLGTVMIPRIGYHYNRGEKEYVDYYMYRAYRFVWMLGVPLCFGLIGISSNVVPWFFGRGFEKVVPLLRILSFLIIAIGISNITGMQYLIPTKKQKAFTKTIIIGAVVNFTLNLFLIPMFGSIGAAYASVVAETAISLAQMYVVRKELSIKIIVMSGWKYLLSGLIMLIELILISTKMTASIIHTLAMIFVGCVTYFAVLLIFRDDFFVENIKLIGSKIIRRQSK